MLTVKVTYTNGTEELKDCWDVNEICLDGVKELKVIRNDRKQ